MLRIARLSFGFACQKMTKSIFLTAVCFSFIISSFAFTTIGKPPVNNNAFQHFNTNYKEANKVSWKVTKEFTKATFIENGSEVQVFYNNPDGELIGTSRAMDFNSLPESAISSIKQQYSSSKYSYSNCFEFTNSNEEVFYYVLVKSDKSSKIIQVNEQGEASVFKVL